LAAIITVYDYFSIFFYKYKTKIPPPQGWVKQQKIPPAQDWVFPFTIFDLRLTIYDLRLTIEVEILVLDLFQRCGDGEKEKIMNCSQGGMKNTTDTVWIEVSILPRRLHQGSFLRKIRLP